MTIARERPAKEGDFAKTGIKIDSEGGGDSVRRIMVAATGFDLIARGTT